MLGFSAGGAVVRSDKVGHLSCVDDTGGRCQRCDYALFFEEGDQDLVLLIELKLSYRGHRDKAITQLRHSRPIVDYLIALSRLEGRPVREYQVRHVILAEKQTSRLDKQHVRRVAMKPIEVWSESGIAGASFVGKVFPMSTLMQN